MVRVLLVTISAEKAENFARQLLEERLIACANLVPHVRSLYWWDGKIQDDSEFLTILKTTESNVSTLLKRIPELHPYQVPEILVLPIEYAHPAYAAWVEASTKFLPTD